MDENLSWKIVYFAVFFSLLVMGIAYYLISPRESPYFTEEKMEKIAEFKNTRVSGRKAGKKVWEFFAQEGWTAQNREITYLYDVSKGSIYMEGKLVVSQLKAPWAKTYRHSEVVEAFGRPEGKKSGISKLSAYLELGRMSDQKSRDQTEWTRMTADFLKYIPKSKRTEIKGDVKLQKKDSTIYAQDISIDHNQKIAHISEKVRMVRSDGELRSLRLRYLSQEEELEAEEEVSVDIQEGGVKTRIKAERASFSADINKDMKVAGKLEVTQGKKMVVGEKGVYSQKKKELLLQDKVKAVFEKARVILREDTAEKLRSPEGQQILKEKTVLTADQLVLSTHSGDGQASGSVYVTQKGREAKSQKALYDESQEVLVLTGDVYMKKEDEWVKAEKVIVSVKDETFEAFGQVEAEFKL